MADQHIRLSYSLDTIDEAVKVFWEQLSGYRVFAFHGDLGAGKTTFIHHLCEHLRVEDSVSSPTFALINEYHFSAAGKDNTIYHLDWYRLKDTAEAINAGMEDCLLQAARGDAYCFVEWPSKAPGLLNGGYADIYIASTGLSEREMIIHLR
jgi:tRNA threonylcarbamoyladenosine biosynthesis protein TsaE